MQNVGFLITRLICVNVSALEITDLVQSIFCACKCDSVIDKCKFGAKIQFSIYEGHLESS